MSNKEATKIVYFGTPEFSARILQGLLDAGLNVVGVVTESDKPVGRSQEVEPCAVKKLALEKGIRILSHEVESMNKELKEIQPDIGVVVAYGKILKKETLEIPKRGFINFHPSLLPQLRGASPIQSAILQGLEKTGVTIMKVDEGMDSGPVLAQVEFEIAEREIPIDLRAKMLDWGVPLLLKALSEYIDGKLTPIPQDESKATYCEKIEKEDGRIDFSKTAEEEDHKFRAYLGWPGTYCFWNDKRIKIISIMYYGLCIMDRKSGEVFLDGDGGLCLMFSDGYWIINRLQLEGKKPMSAKEFLNGYGEIVGAVLK